MSPRYLTNTLTSRSSNFVKLILLGTVGTSGDKKLKEEIFNVMIELFQKGRAAKIYLFLFAQKIDSTNIPSKMLMKTDSDFNINNTIGTTEDIEKITRFHPSNFNKGKAIFKNGTTSDKTLLQVPYISLEQQKALINSL